MVEEAVKNNGGYMKTKESKELNKAIEAVRMTVENKVADMSNQVLPMVERDAKGKAGHMRLDWGEVNWEEQDVMIARGMGCSRERVRQKRKELGIEKSPLWHKRQESVKETLRVMDTDGRTLKDLAGEVGCKASYVMHCLLEMEKGYLKIDRRLPLKYRWDLADWSKTDVEVAEALGVKNPGVVSQYRFRHGIWKRADKVAEAVLAGVER
jgi:hypothetical protein